jgi:hypothetical protein
MTIKIDKDIVWRIKNLQGIKVEHAMSEYVDKHGMLRKLTTSNVIIEIDFTNEEKRDLFVQQINLWLRELTTYFETSYTFLRVNIGWFDNLRPIKVEEYTATFLAILTPRIRTDTWKDWFIREDLKIAS